MAEHFHAAQPVHFAAISVYYAKALVTLKEHRPVTTQVSGTPQSGPGVPRELRFLQFGIAASVMVFLRTGVADAASDALMILAGTPMELCGALAAQLA
jgi:hypothetical protein